MKKTTKFISVLLSGLMVTSSVAGLAAVSASAEEQESKIVYFEYPTDGSWGNVNDAIAKVNKKNNKGPVYCSFYAIYGNTKSFDTPAWETPPTKCTYVKDNIFSFDLTGYGFVEDGADYGILFSTNYKADGKQVSFQTTDLTMTSACIGDTVYVTEKEPSRENAANSDKKDFCAAWRNNEDCGIKANITSLNNLLPGKFPYYQPKAQQLSNALKKYLTNPVNNPFYQWERTAASEQKDGGCNKTTCEALGVTPLEVYNQYAADNASILESGEVKTDDKTPVEYIEYEGLKDGTPATLKLATLKEVAAVLNLEYPPVVEEPTTEEPTTEEPTTEEPTTEEPTTEEPTTEEPTTEEPTTEEPTTEEPTTEEPTTEEPVVEDTYGVAGTPDAIFAAGWDAASAPLMTKGEDGIYSITIEGVEPVQNAMFKVVKNGSWDEAYGNEGNNVVFDVTETCDVTIKFNPETKEVTVEGTGVKVITELEIDKIIAVGNGYGAYLNGVAWGENDDANAMEKVADGVYEITFENCDANDNAQIKFAVNGSWASNFGYPKEGVDAYVTGSTADAAWDGDNIAFEIEEDGSTVKAQLDLREFVFASKTGAKFTVTVTAPEPQPTTEEPTTEEPTEEPTTEAPTEEPTTEAPTEEPTTEAPTEEPTTEAPTEEPTTEEPVVEDTYGVAGTPDAIFAAGWDAASAPLMTKGEDGIYSITIEGVEPVENAMFKVVKNGSWDEAYGNEGNNVVFNVTETCDVTIKFNPETKEVTVEGTGVKVITELEIDKIIAVGNGYGTYLNGVAWGENNDLNAMEKVADGVYEITFENVDANDNCQIKFAVNGSWASNFGYPKEGVDAYVTGSTADAAWDGDNIAFEVEEDGSTVKAQLDLREFDFASKTGAKFTITVEAGEVSDEYYVYGDVNQDGVVTIDDATLVQKAAINLVELTDAQKTLADVNQDGRISIIDTTFIQKYLADPEGPVEIFGFTNLTNSTSPVAKTV